MSTLITLPFPPGVNNLFKNIRRGRATTDRYKAWQMEAGLVLRAQRPTPITGRFNAVLTYRRPDNRIRDIDGLVKAPFDLLKKCGVIEDDHLAEEVVLRWSRLSPSDRGCVTIELEAANV